MTSTKQTIVGIDLGTHLTRVVVCEKNQNASLPRIIGTGSAPSQGVRHGYIANKALATKSLIKALQQAQKNSGRPIKKAYLSIGGISLTSQTVANSTLISKSDSAISPADVNGLISGAEELIDQKYKNRRILHSFPLEYKVDGKVVHGDPVHLRGSRLEAVVLFLTCLEHHLDDLIDVVHAAGISVEDIVASPIALSSLTLSPRQKMVGSVLLDIGSETSTITVFENNHPLSVEVFPLGSSNITNDIALGFRVPLEEAEKIKTGDNDNLAFSKKKIDSIIEARLSDIFELVQNHLKKLGRHGALPGGIMISGGGSTLSTLEEFAKLTLKLPSKVVHIEHMHTSRRHITDSSWLVAYSLCNWAMYNASNSFSYKKNLKMPAFVKSAGKSIGKAFKKILP